jgi:hypothetical protein
VGLVLELLHGFKIQGYLAVSNETRRLMWTLGHAHGVLMALINIVFALHLETPRALPQGIRVISGAMIGAAVLLPSGFLLGGISFYEGDPGVGVILVPIGAVLLLFALLRLARHAGASR